MSDDEHEQALEDYLERVADLMDDYYSYEQDRWARKQSFGNVRSIDEWLDDPRRG